MSAERDSLRISPCFPISSGLPVASFAPLSIFLSSSFTSFHVPPHVNCPALRSLLCLTPFVSPSFASRFISLFTRYHLFRMPPTLSIIILYPFPSPPSNPSPLVLFNHIALFLFLRPPPLRPRYPSSLRVLSWCPAPSPAHALYWITGRGHFVFPPAMLSTGPSYRICILVVSSLDLYQSLPFIRLINPNITMTAPLICRRFAH